VEIGRGRLVSIGCSDCGALQRVPALARSEVASCRACGRLLDRADPALAVSLAWAVAMLLLFVPASTLPVLSASLQGRTQHTWVFSCSRALWNEGWPLLAAMLAAFTIVLPCLWAGLLCVVLGILRTRRRPPWLGRAFRLARSIELWAMPDVLVLAGLVLYLRASHRMSAHVEPAGWCVVALAVLTRAMPRVLAPHSVWRAIAPARAARGGPTIACTACELVLPLSARGSLCPRCGLRLTLRKRDSIARTTALVAAGYLLAVPAYFFPMSSTVQANGTMEHTIFAAMREIFAAGYWVPGLIILFASVLVPFLKLVGLSWLLWSVHRSSRRHLVLKTRLHRLIHEIGRWSHTDPMIVAVTVPLMSFAGIVSVHAGPATLPFALVVVTTMLASRSFDPRLLWDAAGVRP